MSDRNPLRPLLFSFGVAGILALLTVVISEFPISKHYLALAMHGLLFLVPSAGFISGSMMDPEASTIILLAQWFFAPIYIYLWFRCLPPWGQRMQISAQTKGRTLTKLQRVIGFPLIVLFLGAWILGDLGLIGFPTLYNGKFVYPIASGVMQLKYIYSSRIALSLYAWFGPVAEATVVWMLCHLVINAGAFLSPNRSK
jgi:hypothetical protein